MFTPIRNQVSSVNAQLEGVAADVFGSGSGNGTAHPAVDVKSPVRIGRADARKRFSRGSAHPISKTPENLTSSSNNFLKPKP
jgi:hypothetical protein